MSGLTCAEQLICRCERTLAHAKKKKQGCGVCGAAHLPAQEGGGTRQKEKARLWRVRSSPFASPREDWHTPKRKSKIVTCAERFICQSKRGLAHAKKEKAFDVSHITI